MESNRSFFHTIFFFCIFLLYFSFTFFFYIFVLRSSFILFLHIYLYNFSGVGPEHSFLKDSNRAEYYSVTDKEAVDALQKLSKLEGIIPALETSHALAILEVKKLQKRNYLMDNNHYVILIKGIKIFILLVITMHTA